jgi:hypothetical protein
MAPLTGGFLRRIPGFRTNVPWKMAVAVIAYLGMGGIALIAVISLAVAPSGISDGGSNPNDGPLAQAGSPTTTPPPSPALSPSPITSPSAPQAPIPTSTPAPKASPSPRPAPVASPRPKPVPSPIPKPPPVKSTCGAPANPWGYNFCGGSYITSPASAFCSYFKCIASFWKSTLGYVDECRDGTYSHSGGRQGACSYHGGELRPLYRP